jgi:hypothetical protein
MMVLGSLHVFIVCYNKLTVFGAHYPVNLLNHLVESKIQATWCGVITFLLTGHFYCSFA